MSRKRTATTVAALTGSAAIAVTLAAMPAGAETVRTQAQPQAVICDYAPPQRQQQQSAIDARYDAESDLRERLGAPVADEVRDGDVAYREYERGHLYWTEATWVHEFYGDILAKYIDSGGYAALGVPMTDECGAADGVGRYNHLTQVDGDNVADASIYWHPERGAFLVTGEVYKHWERSGWETGEYGYPTTDTAPVGDDVGQYGDFLEADGHGASIYYKEDTGAFGVKGLIRGLWLDELGGPTGEFGYPISDEYDIEGGKRSDFEGGYITFDFATGEVVAHPNE